jgi:AAA domain
MGKSILLSGACGSGKSTLMALGYRALEVHWGPTATIDTDTILMMVDPRWELPHEERRYELAGYQCWLLARSFLTAGFGCVIIGGNGLHTPEEINGLVTLLLRLGEVYHVTLDPSLSEVQRRVAKRGGDQTPEWVAGHTTSGSAVSCTTMSRTCSCNGLRAAAAKYCRISSRPISRNGAGSANGYSTTAVSA